MESKAFELESISILKGLELVFEKMVIFKKNINVQVSHFRRNWVHLISCKNPKELLWWFMSMER